MKHQTFRSQLEETLLKECKCCCHLISHSEAKRPGHLAKCTHCSYRLEVKQQMLDDFRQKFNEGYFLNPLTNDESVNKLEHYISFLIDRHDKLYREWFKEIIGEDEDLTLVKEPKQTFIVGRNLLREELRDKLRSEQKELLHEGER